MEKRLSLIFSQCVENANGCLEWQGYRDSKGYGKTAYRRKGWPVYRLVYCLYNQVMLPKHLFVCHSCDNRCCVNPAHLWAGTALENAVDAYTKGRMVPPDNRVLSDAQVKLAISMVKSGMTQKRVAEFFGVSRSSIGHMASGFRRSTAF